MLIVMMLNANNIFFIIINFYVLTIYVLFNFVKCKKLFVLFIFCIDASLILI